MPLISIYSELKKAQKDGYAIPCFDTFEMFGTQGIFNAFEEKRSPGVIGIYSGMLDRPNSRAFVDYVKAMAEDATIPVSIILDHGASFEHCMKAIKLGFPDVMYDGSRLSVEENIANTKMVVKAAHAVGVSVEAELGHVGDGRTYQSYGAKRKGFTEPDIVEQFINETGVDFLAVAIGTAHGRYEGEPNIDTELLEEIRKRTDIPLVLHGGSGLSDHQFRQAVSGGISKINIFTSLAEEASKRMIESAKDEKASYFSLTNKIREAFFDQAVHHIDVFGSGGKA